MSPAKDWDRSLHLCFYAREPKHVDAFHRAGVEAGVRSNGEPGYRDYGPGYYAAICPIPTATTSRLLTATWETSDTASQRH